MMQFCAITIQCIYTRISFSPAALNQKILFPQVFRMREKECFANHSNPIRMEKLLQGWYQPWSFSIPFLSNLLKNILAGWDPTGADVFGFTEYGLKEAQRNLSPVGNNL